jgi:uncharacterized membrane protein
MSRLIAVLVAACFSLAALPSYAQTSSTPSDTQKMDKEQKKAAKKAKKEKKKADRQAKKEAKKAQKDADKMEKK